MISPKELKGRFAYMFEGRSISITFHKGWIELVGKLCEEIDDLLGDQKRGFHWVQIKEKFGSARLYWAMNTHKPALYADIFTSDGVASTVSVDADENATGAEQALFMKIHKLVRDVEKKTQTRCILCGAEGTLDNYAQYVLVLCDEHVRQRRKEKLPRLWIDDGEV